MTTKILPIASACEIEAHSDDVACKIQQNKIDAVAMRKPVCQVVIIERIALQRDCLIGSLGGLGLHCAASFSSLAEMLEYDLEGRPLVVLLSICLLGEDERHNELELISKIPSPIRTMVLGKTDDMHAVLAAFNHGASGYISMNTGLEALSQATCFVSAGGTYVPPQCLLAAQRAATNTADKCHIGAFSARELSVIEGIRGGKQNKVIAHEMNICESTVKVHLRNVMKKLRAKNRTDVAIKSANLTAFSGQYFQAISDSRKDRAWL